MLRKLAIVSVAVLAGWLALLVVLGFALGRHQEGATREQLAESLRADVTIASSDLALIRGAWQLKGLAVRRADDVGMLALDVKAVRCELAPLGWALVDRDCGELVVRGVRMNVSTIAVFQQPQARRQAIHADHVVIDDATLVFQPSALVPRLGAVEIAIEHAEAGPTLLRSPLSSLLTLRSLRAHLALPAGITLELRYERGVLTAAGSLLGASPVSIPVELPPRAAATDAREEMQQLVALGKDIAQRLVARRAQSWLEQLHP